MPVLTIADSDIIKTARLSTTDTVVVADAAFVSGSEQAAIEATIDGVALANLALRPLCVRNVTKLLAAELLDMRARAKGATGVFQSSGTTIGQEWDHATRLRTEARLALEPYLLVHGNKIVAAPRPEPSLSALSEQSRLFGKTESERLHQNQNEGDSF